MQLCSRCNAAVDEGRSHCRICDLPIAAPMDQTMIQGGPPTWGAEAPMPPGQPTAYPVVGPPPQPYPGPLPAYGHGAPAYGYPASPYAVPMVPAYGMAAVAPPKSKAVAALLCFFLGGLGIHRFYTGQVGLGLGLLLTSLFLGWTIVWLGVTMVWVLVDLILILCGGVRDQWGRPLV